MNPIDPLKGSNIRIYHWTVALIKALIKQLLLLMINYNLQQRKDNYAEYLLFD